MKWFNEPKKWSDDGKAIRITSDPKTDFWRKTHYGFIRDNGHFYHRSVEGAFEARVRFTAKYTDLYDQAGLMVRADETTWIKCGIEFVHGRQFVSAVVTRDYSDWSVVPLALPPAAVWLRVIREGATVEVSFSLDSVDHTMIRTAYLSPTQSMNVGIMCASPEGDGFESVFEGFAVRALER
jgi:regulation of enolase protein 1 (concanavalin A-like superfamily)